jgi:hypothetical protein
MEAKNLKSVSLNQIKSVNRPMLSQKALEDNSFLASSSSDGYLNSLICDHMIWINLPNDQFDHLFCVKYLLPLSSQVQLDLGHIFRIQDILPISRSLT